VRIKGKMKKEIGESGKVNNYFKKFVSLSIEDKINMTQGRKLRYICIKT
jgi:hypothetical protein